MLKAHYVRMARTKFARKRGQVEKMLREVGLGKLSRNVHQANGGWPVPGFVDRRLS